MAKAQTLKKSKTKSKTKARVARKAVKMPKHKSKAKKTVKKVLKAKKKPAAKKATKKPMLKVVKIPAAPVVETNRIDAGDIAPTFTLQDQNGQNVSLTDYLGKKVVLYFYPKDDTPGCTKEACSFRDNIAAFDGVDAVILGVSFDDSSSHQKFIGKYDLNFRLLCDLEKNVAQDYGCYVQKNMYGNISWGIERSTFIIDREGKIATVFRRVQVDGHTHEVIEALKAIA